MGAANHRTAASELKLPIWVSWTLDERQPKLRSGQSIGTALEVLHNAGLLSATEDHSIISALMFNCTSPVTICSDKAHRDAKVTKSYHSTLL